MIAAIWAREGEGKSTMALTFPKPLFHMDLDLGGFDRAAWRFEAPHSKSPLRIKRCEPDEDLATINWSDWDIVSKPYPLPIQVDKLTGPAKLVPTKTEKGISVRMSSKVQGYRELWQIITMDFVKVCTAPEVKSIVPDSSTQLWVSCHVAELQLKQEAQLAKNPNLPDGELRERLQPVEFPNERMRQIIYTARSARKNLILTHYPRGIYKKTVNKYGEVVEYQSDELEPDGFRDTVKLVDVVFWMEKGDAKISIKCGLEGLGMKAVGMALPEASYEGIVQLQKAMRGE